MSDNPNAQLQKEVKRAKRIASEKAGQLHDLIEDELPKAYQQLPQLSQECYDACKHWAELSEKLNKAELTG